MSRDGSKAEPLVNAWDLRMALVAHRVPHVYHGPIPSEKVNWGAPAWMLPWYDGKVRTNGTHDVSSFVERGKSETRKKGWESMAGAAVALAEITGRPCGTMLAPKSERFSGSVYVPDWADVPDLFRNKDNGGGPAALKWVETVGRCPGLGLSDCSRNVPPGQELCNTHKAAAKRRAATDREHAEKWAERLRVRDERQARDARTAEAVAAATDKLAELNARIAKVGHRPDTFRVTTHEIDDSRTAVGVMVPAETLEQLIRAAEDAERLHDEHIDGVRR